MKTKQRQNRLNNIMYVRHTCTLTIKYNVGRKLKLCELPLEKNPFKRLS